MNFRLGRFVFVLMTCGAISLSACGGTPTPTSTPIPTPTLPPTPPPTPTAIPKTVDQVMASWKTSPYLDRVHMEKGLNCQSCHIPFPPQGKPSMETCLSCHGGSYEELAKTTANLLEKNPHQSHLGTEPCTSCHGAHQPFVYLCGTCHTDWTYSGKYPTVVPSQ